MNQLIEKALEAITRRTNLSTGLSHPNDKNAAKEMFKLLHEEGEVLLAEEISSWAESNGWEEKDARELGALGEQIGLGKKVRISDSPWWNENIIENLRNSSE
tara:strand:+ start:539 stop:844 length:306 start_codon:yes stop_codon:yes gene_type:complete